MKKAFLLPFTLLVLLVPVSYSYALKHTEVKGLRAKSYKNHTRIVVDVDGITQFTQNRLANPDRFYFDLKNCNLSKRTEPSLSIGDGILRKVRLAQFDKNTVRIVLEVENSESYSAFMLENPYRLVIDVYASPKNLLPSKQDDKIATPEVNKITTIVIDPGHGGDDPGAIGPHGLQEKDIALSVGKKLGDILAEQPGIKVIFTRDSDIFIPLNERTEIANSKKADLFISVHANASPRKATRGIETYFLNWTNDEEAMKVAARENKISFRKMEEMQGDLQMILEDLARKNKNEESMKLASNVQNSMIDTLKVNYRGIEDLGVKYALFYVLVGAEMPSILVEISFISNHEEERRLSSKQYKEKIAEAIAAGINTYITQSVYIARKNG
jgi:N-acetylmuramoyl-L-alanine amidase